MMSRTRSRHTNAYPPGAKTVHYGSIDLGECMTDELGLRNANHLCSYSKADITVSDGCITFIRKDGSSGVSWPNNGAAWKQGGGREVYSSVYCLRSPIPTVDSGSVLSEMASDVLSKIQEAGRSSVHAISFLREVEETVSMLRNPFKVVSWVQKWSSSRAKKGNLKDAFRSAHFRSAKSKYKGSLTTKEIANIASDSFLESMYGWNPFVHDVQEIARLAGGALNTRKQLAAEGPQKFRVMRSGSRVESIASAGYTNRYPAVVSGGKSGASWRFLYYGTLNVNPAIAGESSLASIARTLNIDRLGYAIWDAVPYSFVVDWFLPLGDLLDQKLSGPAFYIMANTPWVSARIDQFFAVGIRGNADYSSPYDITYAGGCSYGERVRTFNRYPCDINSLLSRTPTQGMHGMRTIAGAALSWGQLRRWHR